MPPVTGAWTPQSADAGRSFIASGALMAVQAFFAVVATATPALESTIAPTDMPTATEEMSFRIASPPGVIFWRAAPDSDRVPAHLRESSSKTWGPATRAVAQYSASLTTMTQGVQRVRKVPDSDLETGAKRASTGDVW